MYMINKFSIIIDNNFIYKSCGAFENSGQSY